ncbi:MAG: RNA polymerase sigma factor (TIGR02999 family) [Planctomycetota bacterium]|jgi:RNA polymerase sigma factor (TIGR02999 family)
MPARPQSPQEAQIEVTQLLSRVAGGDGEAQDQVWSFLYEELRSQARQLAGPRRSAAPQATELISMAYVKISKGPRAASWPDRKHFVAYAVQAMRNALRDHHRKQVRSKDTQPLDEMIEQIEARVEGDLDHFYDALDKFRKLDPAMAHGAELRAMGYEVHEVADLLGLKLRTFERKFARARAHLYGLL